MEHVQHSPRHNPNKGHPFGVSRHVCNKPMPSCPTAGRIDQAGLSQVPLHIFDPVSFEVLSKTVSKPVFEGLTGSPKMVLRGKP
jgi:hypothetical protein